MVRGSHSRSQTTVASACEPTSRPGPVSQQHPTFFPLSRKAWLTPNTAEDISCMITYTVQHRHTDAQPLRERLPSDAWRYRLSLSRGTLDASTSVGRTNPSYIILPEQKRHKGTRSGYCEARQLDRETVVTDRVLRVKFQHMPYHCT